MEPQDWRGAGRASSVGIGLVIATAIGFFLGQWVDRRWGCQPWGTVIGVLLGAGAGFKQLVELVRELDREADRHEQRSSSSSAGASHDGPPQ